MLSPPTIQVWNKLPMYICWPNYMPAGINPSKEQARSSSCACARMANGLKTISLSLPLIRDGSFLISPKSVSHKTLLCRVISLILPLLPRYLSLPGSANDSMPVPALRHSQQQSRLYMWHSKSLASHKPCPLRSAVSSFTQARARTEHVFIAVG
jgi:hypothetical protein